MYVRTEEPLAGSCTGRYSEVILISLKLRLCGSLKILYGTLRIVRLTLLLRYPSQLPEIPLLRALIWRVKT